jgi:AraC family transcriptional activator FtrA
VGPRGPHRVAVLVLDRTMALDLAVALQAFGNRPSAFRHIRDEPQPPYELVPCGTDGARLRTVGLAPSDLAPVTALASARTIIVPGLDEPHLPPDGEVLDELRAADRRGARLVGMCTGTFVLAHAGVLDGHRVTTHWAMAGEFRALFPTVDLTDDELFVDDGHVLTGGGMLAGVDLCLHILGCDLGQAYANDVARLLVSPPQRGGGQAQYRVGARPPVDRSLAPLLDWAVANLARDLTTATLASKANVSPRTLVRRFEVETGMGPMHWLAERRVEAARAMLERADLTVTEVCFACGFRSLATFRRQFRRVTGTSPAGYRRTFGPRVPLS